MRRLAPVFAVLALAGCAELPNEERFQADLQAVADAGAPPGGVTVEVVGLERGDGDMAAFDQTVIYDLKVWRDGQLIGPLVGGVADVRAGGHLRGGRVTVTYLKTDDVWVAVNMTLKRPPSPTAAAPR